MKQRSLKTRLILSYTLIVLTVVFLISIFSNLVLEQQFRKYVIQNQEKRNKEVVSLISQQYSGIKKWDAEVIENIGINALENGMIIKISDRLGRVVWDAREYNNGMCEAMMTHMAQNMYSRYYNWQGEYVTNQYKIVSNDINVGTVEIGYYGPFYYTDSDLAFINTLNKVFIGVGVLSLTAAIIIGIIMAKRLSTPISQAIDMAMKISKGNYKVRSKEKSNINEINNLTFTINNLAETLENEEMLRKRLTEDVAHELRTPLATLQSHMEAMIDGIWKADARRLKSCHEEIMRISRMVGDLEKLAKYEGENLILNKTEFELNELITGIVMNFESEFKNKDVRISFSGEKVIVNADKDKISQVVINLISNALKYTIHGGEVSVSLRNIKNFAEIIVGDTGIGIAENDLPFIFERFYRADKSRNRLTGGAGIGLTIVKSIVEAHKGVVSVKSKLNEGTEFSLLLPKQ